MAEKRYFVERTGDGRYAVRVRGSERASVLTDTQAEAIERAKRFNPESSPNVERVRNTVNGGRDKWRKT